MTTYGGQNWVFSSGLNRLKLGGLNRTGLFPANPGSTGSLRMGFWPKDKWQIDSHFFKSSILSFPKAETAEMSISPLKVKVMFDCFHRFTSTLKRN